MDWARILACVTGTVDQELPGPNEYSTAEKFSDAERTTLGEIAHRRGRNALAESQP